MFKIQMRPDQGEGQGHTRYSQALVTPLRYHITPPQKSYIITVLREAPRAGSLTGGKVERYPLPPHTSFN